MDITLRQIEAFERIARLGSFHAAARELRLSQPSISQRIRSLEETLDTTLFTRRGPKVSLTAEGHAFLEHADRLLGATKELVERFRTHDPLKGVLRLGVSEPFALVCLPHLLRRLEERYPAIRTSIFVGDTGIVSGLLNDRKLDLAIVSEPNVDAHVRHDFAGNNELGWFVRAGVDVPQKVLSPAELAKYHLIISPPTARLHTTVSQWFADSDAAPARISTCNSLSVTILTILHGTAIGLVPNRVMWDEIERGRVKLIPVTPPVPPHRVSICYQISGFGPGLRTLVDLTRELITQYKLFV